MKNDDLLSDFRDFSDKKGHFIKGYVMDECSAKQYIEKAENLKKEKYIKLNKYHYDGISLYFDGYIISK
ncbi:hypothetical protein [Clostridium tyrobutyricum]|uniref:hypothetical protein n=1 Tax=Clostridium tyrobutyricum TaxID=1519 RepID=UPI001C391E4C|nr:hypothetical protein [Clostridium tyrobutyricum]MBV4441229.1 hypothetical protein [Clostridium tyrobutyricum]